ncbi:MAG TPA: hypothetical protein DCY31_06295 [Ruminococcaceae bacterium]|nr:hypothetical protein [Oscillospiraceae bacterium]
MMNDTYRSTIFKYGMYVSNGVYTEKQAYDAAVKDFLSRGINCIEYKDGRRVNIADYTSMAIRTVNQRAYMAGEGEFRKYLGETLVIISHHATSCKLCQPFENKVLIDDVYSGGTPDDGNYMLLSQAMMEGLFHPRCRHGLGTYYPELEDIVHYETEENKLNEYGTEELNRAHIENMIQKYKRLTIGSIDPANIAKYQARLNEWEGRKAQLSIANSENMGYNDNILLAPIESKDEKYNSLLTTLAAKSVDYNPVKMHSVWTSESEMIKLLSGGDQTGGSCASVGLAYIGQKQGWDVLDFRDGESRRFFANSANLLKISEAKGVKSLRATGASSMTVGSRLLGQSELGKEYYLCVGQHAAIVRKTDDGVLQNLELQSAYNSGWINFNGNPRYTLKNRFGCSNASSASSYYDFMIDIDESDFSTDDFKSLLGYINTSANEQRKGLHGTIK